MAINLKQCALAAGLFLVVVAGCDSTATVVPGTTDIPETLAGQAAVLTNQERLAQGLNELAWNDTLAQAAAAHAQDMADRGYFAHESPEGNEVQDRVSALGYVYSWVGENIAFGQSTAAEVVDDWMNSAGHRANILREQFTQIGMAVATNNAGVRYWVQVFARPAGT